MPRGPYDDFTEASYRKLLADVAERHTFGTFLAPPQGPHVIWRHDIDLSPHRARSLARMEAEAGIRATYLVRVRSPFYNVFERPVAKILKDISRDHVVGLHVEPATAEREEVLEAVFDDGLVLEAAVGQPISVVSFHNPTVAGLLKFDEPTLSGMVNVFSRKFVREYKYVSDSGGSWRSPIHEVLDPVEFPRLHVATHPEWWQEFAMSPAARILRGLNGRKDASWSAYANEIEARFGGT